MRDMIIQLIIVFILMMLAFTLAFRPMLSHGATLQEQVVNNSAKYLQVRELTNNNDGPDVERFLAYIGLPKGQSWCMAWVTYVFSHDSGFPWPKYGRCASTWKIAKKQALTYKTFSANEVKMGIEELRPADVSIWAHGRIDAKQDFNGHTGIVLRQLDRSTFATREGNTVPTNAGDQREGGGVYDRTRGLGFGSSFKVVGFIRVR